MFTGLIQSGARIEIAERSESFLKLGISFSEKDWELMQPKLGSSIAINGVCLTVTHFDVHPAGMLAYFDVSPETLDLTNLGELRVNETVHFEPSLKVGQELGGHWVLGHVDGTGILKSFENIDAGSLMSVEVTGSFQKKLSHWVVDKGSVAIDGVSLTINRIEDNVNSTTLSFFLVPHTLKHTRFLNLKLGDRVNLEADLVGKFILRSQQLKEQGL